MQNKHFSTAAKIGQNSKMRNIFFLPNYHSFHYFLGLLKDVLVFQYLEVFPASLVKLMYSSKKELDEFIENGQGTDMQANISSQVIALYNFHLACENKYHVIKTSSV